MIIKITGSREEIAKLAHDIRMMGYKFGYCQMQPDEKIIQDTQCITLLTHKGKLSHYKLLEAGEVVGDKELKAYLPSHRKHFISKVKEYSYGYKRKVS